MFVRQAQDGYDSVGAAGYPDLIVGALYYPVVGWFITRGISQERLARISSSVTLWHVAAFGVAWVAWQVRNKFWGW
jgi:hypothetical protein